MRQQLADHQSVALKLTGKVAELEPLVGHAQARDGAIKQLTERLNTVSRELSQTRTVAAQLNAANQLGAERAAAAERQHATRLAEVERGWSSRLAEAQIIAATPRAAGVRATAESILAADESPVWRGTAALEVWSTLEASTPQPMPDAAVSAADDLQRIRGIGPKLEAVLHQIGVLSYKDIAGWQPTDIERIDAQLAQFKGRITRDGWVQSARAEYLRKYGHEP